MKKPKGFFTYFHHINILERLSDEQAGRLYKALMIYGDTGELTGFDDDPVLDIAYAVMRGEIDVNLERYNEVCQKRREAALKGVNARKGNPEPDNSEHL